MDLPTSSTPKPEETIMSPPKRAKRKSHGWGAKPKSHRVVKNPASEALKELEKIPNPFDELKHENLKKFGVYMFFASQTAWPSDEPISREDVYELVASNLGVSARTIQRWVLDYEKHGKFGESEWGKYPKTKTPMDKVEFR